MVDGSIKSIRLEHVIRFIILILLPFIIGAWVLPHNYVATGTTLSTPATPQQNNSYSLSYSYTQSVNNSAQLEQISSVFPFANYLSFYPLVSEKNPKVCFADQGSTLIYPNGVELPPDFSWTVNFNNKTNVTFSTRSSNCTSVNFNENFSYVWSAHIPNVYLIQSDSVTLVPRTYAASSFTIDYGILQGFALIPASFLLIWYPFGGLLRKIQKGFFE